MKIRSLKRMTQIISLGLLMGMVSFGASAVHDNGAFELDGNALEQATAGDDWSALYSGGGNAAVFTGIKADPSPVSIFTGGRKDIQDVPQWAHKHGSVPDKDDLTNAYAAAYGVPSEADPDVDDLIIYFGADRFSNTGDAFMGFWFFQDKITALPDGSFSGEHKIDDVLVLVDFPQGANEIPYIAVILWDPSCNKAANNDPAPGECVAKNLRMKAESDDGDNAADCAFVTSDDSVCATTNSADEPSPWSYTPKSGVSGTFPFESFYEGGINLSKVVGETCFSSFMAETRSSKSFSATLKDFILGDFELCGLDIVKTCPTGNLSQSGDSIVYSYDIVVTNTGFGTLHDINVVDITAGEQTPIGDYTFYQASLGAGQSVEFSGSFETLTSSVTNYASVTAAYEPGGVAELQKSDSAACPGLSVPGSLNVTKDCDVVVENANGQYGLRVNYGGQVCNDSSIKILDVVLTEIHDNSFDVINVGDLEPGACADYNGSYIPLPAGGELDPPLPAGEVRPFSDTIDAFGTTAIFGDDVNAIQAQATCRLTEECLPAQ